MRKTTATIRSLAGLTADEFASLPAKHQAILLRGGIRGGSEDAPTLDELLDQATPEKASALDDDALGVLLEQIKAEGLALLADPANATDEDIAAAERCEAALTGLETKQSEREVAAAARAEKAQGLLDKIKGETGDGDDPDPEAETEADPEAEVEPEAEPEVEPESEPEVVDDAEKIAAAATQRRSQVTRVAPRSPSFQPRQRTTPTKELVLRASSNVPGVNAGEILDTPEKRSMVLCSAIKAAQGHRGPRAEIPVLSVGSLDAEEVYGPDRYLDDNPRANMRKIDAVTSYGALKASGGKCAPSTVYYDQPVVGTDARPVRDALARFGADRGGVRLIPPPALSDVSSGTDAWTNANDISPSSPSVKPCVTMTCPSDTETFVYAVTQCMKIGNFRAKYFSEQVDAWITKAGQWTARFAERKMLTQMGGLMKNVSVGTELGTTRTVLAGLDRAGAGLRQQLRLPWDFPLRFIGPGWLLDNMQTDLAREQPGAATERLAMADAQIQAFFTNKQINASWALDGESGQEFGAQVDGALNGWPSHAVGYLFIEGEMLALDGGNINLGIVRDQALVQTNDAIMFSEFMENVAFHGNLAYRIDFDICPDGTTSLPVALTPCTTGS